LEQTEWPRYSPAKGLLYSPFRVNFLEFPFPVVLCDIGGTNVRFSLVPAKGARPQQGLHFKTRNFPAFEDALIAAVSGLSAKPRSLIVCAAGPVDGRAVKLTNANWTIDAAEIAVKAGLDQGLLLNDFEAQAFSLPFLEPTWTKPIGPSIVPMPSSELILGLGTGLGVAALLNISGRFFALSSEAGHVDFGPLGTEETVIWPYLDKGSLGRVCAETILSGHGLLRLHRARCAARSVATAIPSEIALIDKARENPRGEEAATLRHCWLLVARFAGDLALAFLAKGGVTLAGGILPRIVEFCDPARFRAAFESKTPYGELMRAIGTRLIVAENTVFSGMAKIAAAPQDFAINYAQRAGR
jgi:glucokinase